MAVHVLVLAAFYPELAPFREELGDTLTGVCSGRTVAARVAGIGLPAAAAGAATHIAELEPAGVVLVGTCGAYVTAGLALGDVVVARRLHLVDRGSLIAQAEFPEPISVIVDANGPMTDALSARSKRTYALATTLAITVDDSAALRIAEGLGAHVEHLEAHGVAVACAARGIPFAAVLGVANFVGARGREEWRRHRVVAEAAAVRHVLRWLELGAQGVTPRAGTGP